ncbi:aminotransferase class III-fold pyridoxal phosphate-dependent enzyme [Pelagibacteraceae bacterium]|nr:aminotransferase class III-fold pyridoxal phosphate-dependent enzyme [Pelagibacteraceae bacterium]
MKNKKIKTTTGQKIYTRAKKIIPGGNMLISKRPELFLPGGWPPYFKKTKGCEVWDSDNNKYFDLSLMGVGTNILGYSNRKVDKDVSKVIKNGNISTLNCYEEVLLAEKLIDLHPWAKMVKFARTGGEANAIAIRVARAASGRDNVAFCGYHGWHDWYLATNIKKNKNLNDHLLKNLLVDGVPKNLANSIFPFKYNDYEQLEKIVNEKNIGVICMEVMRNEVPKNFFLQKIRKLADKKGIVLIFDECTSGFRKNYGGLHKLYSVNPDIALFGKAMGNGYAITAVIGKKEVMENAQNSFISSTFWTERIGPTAALATLKEMKRIKSWEIIDQNGKKIIKGWRELGKKYGLKIETFGLPALCGFKFLSKNNQKYKTLITQEMLKKGFLSSNQVYSSVSHTKKIIDKYFYEIDKIFKLIQKCEDGYNINKVLKFPVSSTSFQRLN